MLLSLPYTKKTEKYDKYENKNIYVFVAEPFDNLSYNLYEDPSTDEQSKQTVFSASPVLFFRIPCTVNRTPSF